MENMAEATKVMGGSNSGLWTDFVVVVMIIALLGVLHCFGKNNDDLKFN